MTDEQLALDALFAKAPGPIPAGRVELAVQQAIAVADIDPQDQGAALAAVELARGMDEIARGPMKGKAYGLAAIGKELREQLARLKLDPEARDTADGADAALAATIEEWSKPSV